MSTLLEQASLVMIPSGYKEDVVYSQIPTNGNGDLSFTRASNGTRINSAGLVEVCPWNLLENSENFSAIWGQNAVTTSSNSATAPNGTTTADSFTSSATTDNHVIYQFLTGQSGTYTFSAYVKKVNSRYVYIKLVGTANDWVAAVFDLNDGTLTKSQASGWTGLTASSESVGNGWYRLIVSGSGAVSPGTFNGGIQFTNTGTPTFGVYADATFLGTGTIDYYIWGAQLNIGSTAKPYFPTTDRQNVPRLTYQNGGGGCPSLLLEKQSTNLVTYSEQFDNAGWTQYQGATITANSVTSPDGTQNADTLTVASGQTYSGIYQSVSASSDVYTVSIFAKYNTKRWLFFFDASASAQGWFDIQNGVLGTIPSGHTGTIENFGNGWYRCTFKKNTAVTPAYFQIGLVDSDGFSSPTSNGSSYIWGAQLEASSYPTSYIPTTSSSATRVADVASVNLPNTNMTFTAYLECEEAPIGTSAGDWFSIYSNVSILGRAYGYSNLFGFADAYNFGELSGTKMVWKQISGSTAKLFKNGVLLGTTTTGTYTDPFNRLLITGAYLDKPVKIKQFVFFDNALTDAECIQLTA